MIKITRILTGIALNTLVLLSSSLVMATDITPYTVIMKEDKFEIREYQSMVLATVNSVGNRKLNNAFRDLFGYISGDNDTQQKINMTAPVFVDYDNEQVSAMSFIMPNNMPLSETPRPDNNKININQIEAKTFATLRFSGRLTHKKVARHEERLRAWIKKNDLNVQGELLAAGYDAPFVPPFMRRNEVLIAIEAETNTANKL